MAEVFKQIITNEESVYLNQAIEEESPKPVKEKSCAEEHDSDFNLLKEQAREEGYKTGFTQGMAEGFKQGEQQAARQATRLLQQLENLLQTIPQAVKENRQALKTEIADIVLAIAQQFFVYQQQNKEAITMQINHALEQVNHKQSITLILHPNDLALLQNNQLKINAHQYQDLRITADETIRLGGCLIKSEHGIFDASIERQIDRLKQVLVQIKQRELHG
ncbi:MULTISPECIES: FliH/SctL family protein [unclassified Legionella]|uniref:FliH/SctL family protein n=1 Tax=unclassified Legionella TaxID=2622702 RepID=UPI001055443F|nr:MULTISPECIES: FliH/SctL family protein [unclassified Legionella]MDI9817554.1 FliH/SctL family protein [Legionella sp. PL877]